MPSAGGTGTGVASGDPVISVSPSAIGISSVTVAMPVGERHTVLTTIVPGR